MSNKESFSSEFKKLKPLIQNQVEDHFGLAFYDTLTPSEINAMVSASVLESMSKNETNIESVKAKSRILGTARPFRSATFKIMNHLVDSDIPLSQLKLGEKL